MQKTRQYNVCPRTSTKDALFDIIKRGAKHRGSLFGCIYVCVCHSLTDKEHNGRKLVRWCYLKEVVAYSLYHFYIVILPTFSVHILVCPFFSFLHIFFSVSDFLSISANIQNKKKEEETAMSLFSCVLKILLSDVYPKRIFFLYLL